MRADAVDDLTLELASLHRAALARVLQRLAEQQLGEAWTEIEEPEDKQDPRKAA